MVFIAIVCVVVVSGVFQIRLLKPYAEIENIQQVLLVLQSHIEPGDGVYIYPGAAFAVDFYVRERDRRFIYGDYHQKEPEKHVPEILAGLGPEENRLWLVFSHIYRDEDKRILHDLSVDWKVEPVLSVTGSALYLATRRRPGVDAAPTGPTNTMIEAAKTTPGADHTHDSFWDWNVRNSRYPAH